MLIFKTSSSQFLNKRILPNWERSICFELSQTYYDPQVGRMFNFDDLSFFPNLPKFVATLITPNVIEPSRLSTFES